MSSDLQTVVPFDIDGEGLPEALSASVADEADAGLVLALLADPATRESGWAPQAALALARGWSRAGRRVLLLDGNLADPVLHALLDEPNGEGVTDAVLYGVSPARMVRSREEGFLFASAGTAVADPSSVLRHPRWRSVLGACRESGALVLLYLPAGTPGADTLAGEGDRVFRLRSALSASAGGTPPDHWVLHPPRTDRTSVAAQEVREAEVEAGPPAVEGAGSQAAAAVGGATDREGADEASTSTSTSGSPAGGDTAKPEAPVRETTGASARSSGLEPRPVKRRISVLAVVLLILLLLLVGGIVAAAFLGLLEIPGITPPADAALLSDHPVGSS